MSKTSKELVISHALQLFKVQGYHKTSMADIGTACGLLKGSIYNYFASKEALAIAAMAFVHDYFRENIFAYAYDQRPILERVASFTQAIEIYFTAQPGGCLMGNLALEVGDTLPQFATLIRAYFDDWAKAVAHLLTSIYDQSEAEQQALVIVGNTQGAIMMMRLYQMPELLHQVNQAFIELFAPPQKMEQNPKTILR